jgi:hypothetical protein
MCSSRLDTASISVFDAVVCKLRHNYCFQKLMEYYLFFFFQSPEIYPLSACSFGWWLMAGAGLFGEKSTADWLLMADLF